MAGESLLALLKDRARSLQLAPFVREQTEARLKAEGIPGMDETRIYKEWVNDVLADPDVRVYAGAAADPVRAYGEFVTQRIADPTRVSYRAVRALEKRVGSVEANKFVHLHWHQEIAWAKRMRASDDPRTAVLSHLFMMAVAKDPAKAFTDLAGTWAAAWSNGSFSRSPSHELTDHAIRYGNVQPAHVPAFLTLVQRRDGEKLDRMSASQLSGLAIHVRRNEESELGAIHAVKAAAVARRTPLSRIMGVIGVAMEMGRNSNVLWADESRFLQEMERGRVPCPTARLPYSEFINWLRAEEAGADPGPPAPGTESHRALANLQARPATWIAGLPSDYVTAGGNDPECFHAWLMPIARKQAATPHDLVSDYGFHLVRKTYRH